MLNASPVATRAIPGSVLATNLKVSGVRVFSAGDFLGAPGTEAIVLSDPGLKTYKKLVIANDRLVGAVLFGDTADGPWYLDLIRSGGSDRRLPRRAGVWPRVRQCARKSPIAHKLVTIKRWASRSLKGQQVCPTRHRRPPASQYQRIEIK